MKKSLYPITPDRVDPDAAKVVRRLVQHDYEAYLVGGCVRDLLVGRRPKDFDVSTSATPTEIKSLFRNSRIIGRRFRLAHIFFGQKIIETSTFRAPPQRREVEDLDDEETEDLLIWQDNAFGTAEEDALRRDFTINGLFYDLRSDSVIDWVGGLRDLRAGCVRTIGDPDVRFQEDPVRILRAVKFATRMDFVVEPMTERAMITHRGLIARCSIARLLEEIYRLLHGGSVEAAFRLMHRLGVLPVLFPEVAQLVGPAEDQRARGTVTPIRAGQRRRLRAALNEQGDRRLRRGLDVTAVPDGEAPGDSQAGDGLLEALGLGSDEVRATAAAEIWAHLRALDELVRSSRETPSHAILLAAPLLPLAHAAMDPERRTGWCIDRVDLLVRTVATRLQVSRRDRERLKQLLVAQRRLTHGNPRRQIIHRDYFPEALQLLRLRDRAVGGFSEAVGRWEAACGGRQRRRRRRPKRNIGEPSESSREASEQKAGS